MVMCYRNTNIFCLQIAKITWQQIKCRKYIYKKNIYIIHLLQENSKALSHPQDKS